MALQWPSFSHTKTDAVARKTRLVGPLAAAVCISVYEGSETSLRYPQTRDAANHIWKLGGQRSEDTLQVYAEWKTESQRPSHQSNPLMSEATQPQKAIKIGTCANTMYDCVNSMRTLMDPDGFKCLSCCIHIDCEFPCTTSAYSTQHTQILYIDIWLEAIALLLGWRPLLY